MIETMNTNMHLVRSSCSLTSKAVQLAMIIANVAARMPHTAVEAPTELLFWHKALKRFPPILYHHNIIMLELKMEKIGK